jgi:hypothetical protein
MLRQPFHEQMPEAAEFLVQYGIPSVDDDAVAVVHYSLYFGEVEQ